MLTAARIRDYTGEPGALALFRDLGYPVAPVDVDPAEWRRGGVAIPWDGEAKLRLAARMRAFDLFVLAGRTDRESIATFLRSYKAYNQATKSIIVYTHQNTTRISIFDISPEGVLRLFDVDTAAPSAHAVDRLNLLQCGDERALPRIFDRALDRESITRRFFRRFRAATDDVADALARAFPGEEREEVRGEALLLLSRLLFLSFVQEKGWLDGQRRFLVDRMEHAIAHDREFFSSVLLPLFFGCLNTPLHERTLGARRLGEIPYLNGGLFEPSPFEQRHPAISLPNPLVQRIVEEVFERFDFRIDERDGCGAHVDPEMLGKVFESLMASGERSASGSYYTPREIVDTLCTDAVEAWLARPGGETPAARLERLGRIRVIDPACGSGAFLLSALGVIEREWRRLAAEARVDVPADVRRRIVAHSLYGVDLKPEAVRLCELRLWLAIVAGTEGPPGQVEPLPNLDRNILQGNSLLGPADFLGDARRDVYGEWLHAVRAQADLVERYRTAPHGQRPAIARVIRGNDLRLASEFLVRCLARDEEELRRISAPRRDLFGHALSPDAAHCAALHERIADARLRLERVEEGVLDFFSFEIHFAPVLAAGGFDVVVGNPPWVRNARIEPQTKRMLADRYPLFRRSSGSVGFHQPDLCVAFFERATALAADGGVVSLLMPAKIANASYAAPLRRRVAERHRLIALHDWSDDPRARRWFEADTFPLGVVLTSARESARAPVAVTAVGSSFAIRADELTTGEQMEWMLVPPEVGAVLRRIRARFRPLTSVLGREPFMGVKTGDNGAFFVEVASAGPRAVRTSDGVVVPLHSLCRVVRGRDVRRWVTAEPGWMLWPPAGGWKNVPAWLRRFAENRLADPRSLRLSFVRPEHVGVKVAWKDLSRGIAAAVLPATRDVCGAQVPLVPNQTLYAIDAASLDEAYALAALLNSTVAEALLVSVAERAKDRHYRYFGRTIAALPVPEADGQWARLARAGRKASLGADAGDLDRLVAGLYGVAAGELDLLRKFVEERLGARAASD